MNKKDNLLRKIENINSQIALLNKRKKGRLLVLTKEEVKLWKSL